MAIDGFFSEQFRGWGEEINQPNILDSFVHIIPFPFINSTIKYVRIIDSMLYIFLAHLLIHIHSLFRIWLGICMHGMVWYTYMLPVGVTFQPIYLSIHTL